MSTNEDDLFPSYLCKQSEIDAAWALCEQRLSTLPTPLGQLASKFLASVSNGSQSPRAYFSNPCAPPLLYMPLWLADGLQPADPHIQHALVPILAATMHGYIAIRLQDNVLDEPKRTDPSYLLLGNTCFSFMVRELAQVVTGCGSSFWRAFDQTIVTFSNLTAVEQDAVLHDNPYDYEDFVVHAEKVAFAAVPLLAVAALANRLDLEDQLRLLVHQLGVAYGIANDVLGWPRDARHGHRTWLLAQAGFSRTAWEQIRTDVADTAFDAALAQTVEELRTRLYEGGLLRDALEKSITMHKLAADTAQRIGLVGFDAFTAERIAWIQRVERQTQLLTLKRALVRAQPGA